MNAKELIERLVARELESYAGPDILEEEDIWCAVNDIQFAAHQILGRCQRGELTMETLGLSTEKVENTHPGAKFKIDHLGGEA